MNACAVSWTVRCSLNYLGKNGVDMLRIETMYLVFVCAFCGCHTRIVEPADIHLQNELTLFCLYFNRWVTSDAGCPADDLAETVRRLSLNENYAESLKIGCPHVMKLCDYWGNAFRYSWDVTSGKMTIMSCGVNGRWDAGQVDDIVCSIDVRSGATLPAR